MMLLIDVGNTRIKLRCADHHIALVHQEIEQLLPWLQSHQLCPTQAIGIYVSSISLAQQMEQLLLSIGCPTEWLSATTPSALIHNNYDEPQRLGADRWLALIGILAQQTVPLTRPIVHASFGTATTVDTIMPAADPQQKAQFIGGLILPGPKLMYDSLALNTAQLGEGIGPTQAFPTNTRAAISSGIGAAQAGAVLHQWQLARQKNQGTPSLVCSGGGWNLIQEAVVKTHAQQLQMLDLKREAIQWQATPVLDGLSYLSIQKNK